MVLLRAVGNGSDMLIGASVSILLCSLLAFATKRFFFKSKNTVPISVNYHFTRKCNRVCGFCFHTEKSSYILNIEDAKRGLTLLKQAGMKKINFAGGEPFLYPKFLGELCHFCKTTLNLESVSIVTNGTLVHENWFQQFGKYVDIMAVSCDSFNEETNKLIGRGHGYNVDRLKQIACWCKQYNVLFKMNTVVCRYNFDEDMVAAIAQIAPFRWKCFQVLVQPGENSGTVDKKGEVTIRDATPFKISVEEFEEFCDKHKGVAGFVAEPNRLMAASYLILDEYMCFLDKEKDFQSKSILEVGVQEALAGVHWDEDAFFERGGEYDWTNTHTMVEKTEGCGSGGDNSSFAW